MPLMDNQITSHNRKHIINKLIDKKLVYSLRADMKSAENIINSKINEIANQ